MYMLRSYFSKEKWLFFFIILKEVYVKEIIENEIIDIENIIYEVRGVQVMLGATG